ncbi:ABC transporter permease [Halanaerobium hydrogeniformans]|uniref:Binding-protein-dependent transport systems inner membrane component n=1 Tax=Halanaerobium hydrogeniformans TaxID=656519 RepID=E4RIY1_HALHG|nr:ABC transporter permease [Halanaerobium hydrogeniformans]ADQ15201.1 binding-protein-dependent transport systems inner membrane component [Halanaerobium hydrogeniformans]
MSIINYFFGNLDNIIEYTFAHLYLLMISITLSLFLWLSVGIIIRNKSKTAKTLIAFGSFIMAVPSISLYGILMTIPAFGLNIRSAVFALVLYSMIPILRNVYTALNGVNPAIIESARAMGMSERQILWKIQFPLALPVIIAGVRVALVMMVGIATLAVFIGERNLGQLIYQGIVRTRTEMIVTGAVLVSAISVSVDILMGFLEKKFLSPGVKKSLNLGRG